MVVTLNELATAETLSAAGFDTPAYIAGVQLALALTGYLVFRVTFDWVLYNAGNEVNERLLAAAVYFIPTAVYAWTFLSYPELVSVFGVRLGVITTGGFAVLSLLDWRGRRWIEPYAERLEPVLEEWGVV